MLLATKREPRRELYEGYYATKRELYQGYYATKRELYEGSYSRSYGEEESS